MNARTFMNINIRVVLATAFAGAFLFAGSVAFGADPGYHLVSKISLPGEGSQDYLYIDQTNRRLYVSHQTAVEVVDLDTEKPVGRIEGMDGVHGIAVASKLGHGFITGGNSKTVRMFDIKTLKTIADIPVQRDGPDGLVYEPVTDRVFVFEHKGTGMSVIDAMDGKVLKETDVNGQAEFPVVDGKGTVWEIVETTSLILKIDAKTMEILATWPIGPACEGPSGHAIDVANRRLFAGCNNEKMSVVDADTGKIIQTLPIGVHIDATVYDPATKLIFNCNRGSITVIHQDSPDQYSVVQTFDTSPRANTEALDLKTHKIYTSTSMYQPNPNPAPGGRGGDVRVPNSFTVLVYGQ
jgi:DNA-binding beta-propeller fold protein YncE